MKWEHLFSDLENASFALAKDSVEIGLATIFVFGQMISGFDEKWFPLVFQQMDWNQKEHLTQKSHYS